jgi:hypothetical protein
MNPMEGRQEGRADTSTRMSTVWELYIETTRAVAQLHSIVILLPNVKIDVELSGVWEKDVDSECRSEKLAIF